MKKKVILWGSIFLVVAIASLVGGWQYGKHKVNSQVKKLSAYYGDHDKKRMEQFEKEAVVFDIDRDGKREVLYTEYGPTSGMASYYLLALDPSLSKPYVKQCYLLASEGYGKYWDKGEMGLEHGVPRLRVKFGKLYFELLDQEHPDTVIKTYKFKKLQKGNLLFKEGSYDYTAEDTTEYYLDNWKINEEYNKQNNND